MGSISPQRTPALLPMLFAKAASSKQPSGWWCQPSPSDTFLSPVPAAGRHAGRAPGAAGTSASPPLFCVTGSLHVSPGSGCRASCSAPAAWQQRQDSRPCSLCLNTDAVYWEFSSTPQPGAFQEVCLPQVFAAPRGCILLQKFTCRKLQDSPYQWNLKQVVFETPVLSWPEERDLVSVSGLVAAREMWGGASLSSGGN